MTIDHVQLELVAEVMLTDCSTRATTPLALVDALDELLAWLMDPRPYRKRFHPSALRSAATDVRAALAVSGSAIDELVGEHLKQFSVENVITEASDGVPLSCDVGALVEARTLLISDPGLRAIWSDLIASASGEMTQTVRMHLDGLERLDACRGGDVTQRFRAIAGILQDRLLDVEDARSWFDPGRRCGVRDLGAVITATAGLSVSDRIELSADVVLSASLEADYVVWLAIERASMPQGVLTVGSTRFFDSRLVTESLKQPPHERSRQLPAEIRMPEYLPDVFPFGQTTLLARLDMGRRKGDFVTRDARRRLLTILAPADRVFANDWKVAPGSATFTNGRLAGWSTFQDLESLSTFHLDNVAIDWLRETGQTLEALLPPEPNGELDHLLQLVEWDAAHHSSDSLTTVLLSIRAIETISQRHLDGSSWQQLLRRYVPHFCWSRLKAEVGETAGHALYAYEQNPLQQRQERLRAIFLETVGHRGTATTTNLALFVDHLPELIDLWTFEEPLRPDPVMVRRAVRVADLRHKHSLWTNAATFERALADSAADAERQIGRLSRLRNAAQHGGPIPTASVESVAPLANRARRQVLLDMLHGLLDSHSCKATANALDRLNRERLRVLQSSGSPLQAIAVRLEYTRQSTDVGSRACQ